MYFFQAESMKHEAGGVLGEVKRKQTDATRAVELLKALTKLREARKQEAEVKGNLYLVNVTKTMVTV
mgnify:CR=1 FL=1